MNIPLTITKIQEGLKKKDFSAVELVDAYLNRITTFDDEINSFITLSDDVACEKAKWVDKTIKSLGKDAFKKHPLLGSVVAHKDLFLTKGIRTTAASKVLESYVPTYSATVVDRLEDAGCICIGKTNRMPKFKNSSGGE